MFVILFKRLNLIIFLYSTVKLKSDIILATESVPWEYFEYDLLYGYFYNTSMVIFFFLFIFWSVWSLPATIDSHFIYNLKMVDYRLQNHLKKPYY